MTMFTCVFLNRSHAVRTNPSSWLMRSIQRPMRTLLSTSKLDLKLSSAPPPTPQFCFVQDKWINESESFKCAIPCVVSKFKGLDQCECQWLLSLLKRSLSQCTRIDWCFIVPIEKWFSSQISVMGMVYRGRVKRRGTIGGVAPGKANQAVAWRGPSKDGLLHWYTLCSPFTHFEQVIPQSLFLQWDGIPAGCVFM